MKAMKKISGVLTLCVCFCLCFVQAFAVSLQSTKDFYVNDYAGVLTEETKEHIIAQNVRLENASGAQVVVVTLNDTEGLSLEEYTYQLFNEWGIGSKQNNNGVLLVLDIAGQDYQCLQGTGLEDTLTTPTLSRILQEDLEPDFAKGDYDAGVYKTFDSLAAQIENLYGADGSASSGTSIGKILMIAFFILVCVGIFTICILAALQEGEGGGSDFTRGMMVGASLNRRSRYHRYHRGGFGGGSRGGGGGSSRGGGAGRGH